MKRMDDVFDYKEIIDIIEYKFNIPSYQRGYRWDNSNVMKFVEDIYEDKMDILNEMLEKKIFSIGQHEKRKYFSDKTKYCIQPLIVKKENKIWNVIDGQQRLTTIFIMISVLNFCKEDNINLSINYESRKYSKEFLDLLLKINSKDENIDIWEEFQKNNSDIEKNIDFEYMENTYKKCRDILKNILQQNCIDENEMSYKCLLDILLYCCQFIWYPIDSETNNEREQFAKINMGKIELTDSELMKAEFLNPRNYDEKESSEITKKLQFTIAEKWYVIETELHNPDFWQFIPHENQYEENEKHETRIDILFQFLMLNNYLEKNSDKNIEDYLKEYSEEMSEEHFLFYKVKNWIEEEKKINKNINKNEIIENCWIKVVGIFENIKELYEDDGREVVWRDKNKNLKNKYNQYHGLYNLVGFYIYAYNYKKENGSFSTSGISNNIDKSIKKALRIYYEIYDVLKEDRNKRINKMKEKIKQLIFYNNNDENGNIASKIKNMDYESNKDKISIVLLLYNIILLNSSSGIGNRYDFFNHAKQNWTREHIFPQIPYKEKLNYDEKKQLLFALCKYISNGNIVIKKCKPLEYLNYKYSKKGCPIKELKNSGIIPVCDNKVEEFIKLKDENIESKYVQEYAKNIYLIKQCEIYFHMIDFLKELEIKFNESKLNIIENNEKIDFINNNRKIMFNYSENILFSHVLSKLKLDASNKGIDYYIEKCLENKDLNSFLNKLTNQYEISKNKKITDIIENEQKYYESMYISRESDKYIFINKIRTQIKEIIRDDYENKINNMHSSSNFLDFIINVTKFSLKEKIDKFFIEEYYNLLNDNSMGNMTLLDQKVNGDPNVGNKPYNEKKEKIYKMMKRGAFIPLATMLVFTDLYTTNMEIKKQWMQESRLEYMKDIVDTICKFFGEKDGCNE